MPGSMILRLPEGRRRSEDIIIRKGIPNAEVMNALNERSSESPSEIYTMSEYVSAHMNNITLTMYMNLFSRPLMASTESRPNENVSKT